MLGVRSLLAPDTVARRRKARGQDRKRDSGQGRGKRHQKLRKRKQRKQPRTPKDRTGAEAIPATCCKSGNCTPGPGKNLSKCCYEGQNLTGANFRAANLGQANFSGANLSNASFQGANLGQTCFVDALTRGATIGGANLSTAIFCRTLMPDGSFNDRDCGRGTRCCPAPLSGAGEPSAAECIGAPNAQCSLNVPYGGCCPGLRCVFSATNPARTTCQAPCGNDRVCHRFGAGWHCAHEPVICRYLRGSVANISDTAPARTPLPPPVGAGRGGNSVSWRGFSPLAPQ